MNKILIPFLLLLVGLAGGYFINEHSLKPVGSVTAGNEYYSTTTGATNTTKTIKSGYGALGSVVITTAGDQAFSLYDATTTDVNKRTGNKPTSTILLASFPASASVGTYTFDVTLNYGLLKDVVSGSLGTSTITYR